VISIRVQICESGDWDIGWAGRWVSREPIILASGELRALFEL
jgi:hypothetical protein